MESSHKYLSELRDYIDKIDNEVTMILQSLQWDRNTLLQAKETVVCKYDSNHIIPIEKIQKHEEKCSIKSKGYSQEDILLPEPLDPSACTLVKFTSDNINDIIENAAKCDPLFKKVSTESTGLGISNKKSNLCYTKVFFINIFDNFIKNTLKRNIYSKKGHRDESEPLTLERLQATYTADERRAIHDAVVSTMPSFHDLSDLILPSEQAGSVDKQKSRQQVLAELRDMKRRRTRYRVAVPTRNYSHVLRQVISTQMELYTESQIKVKDEPYEEYCDDKQSSTQKMQQESSNRDTNKKREHYRERESHSRENTSRNRDGRYQRDYNMSEKYKKYDDDYDRKRQDKEKHSYHRNKNERDSYSSSRNGKRHCDAYERDGYRDSRKNYDNSYRYEKQREHSREKKYREYR
ncbi:unnamed protein product, partial [Brenthis ino]